jgi:hypothetical protein
LAMIEKSISGSQSEREMSPIVRITAAKTYSA